MRSVDLFPHPSQFESWRGKSWAAKDRAEHLAAMYSMPGKFRPVIEREFMAEYVKAPGHELNKLYAAKNYLGGVLDTLGGGKFNLASNEADLREFAAARAGECFRLGCMSKVPEMALAAMQRVAERCGITPKFAAHVEDAGKRARFMCPLWWRRQVRSHIARKVEGAAIRLGMVNSKRSPYASHETVSRRLAQKKRNRHLLENILATNELGQSYTLAELSDLGVSNPEIRRLELMTRIAGFDEIAKLYGHAAEFYTLTAPSKYHAIDSASGRKNPKYNGSTPKETQAYLCKAWARIRAKLARHGVRLYGFRVAEPHHDATPHWHMVMFYPNEWEGDVRRAAVPRVRAIMRRYALAEDGGESGARKHRFVAEGIDRSKGSAAGYIAKYISKNIDAHRVGVDYETGGTDARANIKRVDAWAAAWGIRQFQQVGGAAVTVYREARKEGFSGEVSGSEVEKLDAVLAASDSGRWDLYQLAQFGVTLPRKFHPVKLLREWSDRRTRYDGEGVLSVVGLESGADILKTRVRVWEFQRKGGGGEIRDKRRSDGAGWDSGRGLSGVCNTTNGNATLCYMDADSLEVVNRDLDSDFKRGGFAAPPWSSVNNCTRESEREKNGFKREGSKAESGSGKQGSGKLPDSSRNKKSDSGNVRPGGGYGRESGIDRITH